MAVPLILVFLLPNLVPVQSTPLKGACEALSGTKAYAFETCIVLSTLSGQAHNWQNHCTHFKNGHLLVIPNRKVFNFARALFPSIFVWVGLFQFDTSDEPTGNWVWLLNEGKRVPAPYSFYQPFYHSTDPNNFGNTATDVDCTYLNHVENGFLDLECSYSMKYACQYEEPTADAGREYRKAMKGYKGNDTAKLAQINVVAGPHGLLLCAHECDAYQTLCFSFAIDFTNGLCLLYQDTVDSSDYPPVEDVNFVLYERLFVS